MTRAFSIIFDSVMRQWQMEAARARGNHLETLVAPPSQGVYRNKSPGKPSRYKPAPCDAPRGKRRRQWR